ncbi:MAG: T9SS type A sorting domain-containing protein, partial [Bacteroidota bacterium]
WQVIAFNAQGDSLDITSLNIQISGVVMPTVNLLSDSPTFPGSVVTLSGTGAGMNGSYLWEIAGLSSNENPFQFSAPPVGSYLGTLTATNDFGCIGNTDFSLTVSPAPIDFMVNIFPNELICFGEEFALTATEGYSYLFVGPVGQEIPSNNNELILIADDFTRGEWMVVGINDGVPFDTITLEAEVANQIFPDVLITPATPTQGFPISLEGIGGDFNAGYEWSLDGAIYTNNPLQFTPQGVGSYFGSLLITNSNGCSASTNFSFQVVNSSSSTIVPLPAEAIFPRGQPTLVDYSSSAVSPVFFPNPTSQSLTVHPSFLSDLEGDNILVEIRNITGQLIQRRSFVLGAGSISMAVDQWPAGLYFFTLLSPNGGRITEKIVVHAAAD